MSKVNKGKSIDEWNGRQPAAQASLLGKAQKLIQETLGVLDPGDQVVVMAVGSPDRFLLVAGRELGEPGARHGPFVMNTRQEIVQAIQDFQSKSF
jgi:hypothetical protein